jgi:hypothetical protein
MASSVGAAAPGAEQQQPEQEQQEQQVMFCLNIFETLDQAQSSHGIPLQDYAQYHAYCRKRLHRLTHHKEVRTILTHNAKYEPGGGATGSGGGNKLRRHAYCPRNVSSSPDLMVSHEYVLWHLFFQAERAWAQACAAQKEDTSATSSSSSGVLKKKKSSNSNGCQHNHVRRRLNKAVKWATQFVQLVTNSGCCPERTIQEAQAYLAWMQANAHLECKHYADAYRRYQTSRRLLLHLAKNATKTTTEDAATATNNTTTEKNADAVAHQLVISDLWTRWAESILKPLVRYCLHEARDTLDAAEVLALETAVSFSESSSGSGGLTSPKKKANDSSDGAIRLAFRNQEIALDAYPQLAVLYLKMEEHLFPNANDGEEEKNKKQPPLDEAEFLQLLTDLDDATSLTSTEAAKYTRLASTAASSTPGPAVQAKRTELATLQSFFTHSKLQLQRQRQEERVATLSDVAEIVHVYDALLQNAQALADLHTFQSDKHAVQPELQQQQHAANEDDPYWLEAQARLVRIRAFRCFHLARLYESMPANSSSSAGTTTMTTASSPVAALLQQASLLQQRATEEVAACEMDDVYSDALQDLQKDIQAMTCRIEATRFLELQASTGGASGGSSIGKTTDRPLWLRLDDLDAGTGVLADQPPLLIPIPYKPVFYDLAWDHVFENDKGLQTLQNYIQEHGESKEDASSSSSGGGGGIFGWFSSK